MVENKSTFATLYLNVNASNTGTNFKNFEILMYTSHDNFSAVAQGYIDREQSKTIINSNDTHLSFDFELKARYMRFGFVNRDADTIKLDL